MKQTELRELLQDNAYIIKQHIGLCNEAEKGLPLRAYERTIRALNDLEPSEEQKQDQRLLNSGEYNSNEQGTEKAHDNASGLLIAWGLLNTEQASHPRNQNFLSKCDAFLEENGQDRFIKVLSQVKDRKDRGKVKNIYAYIQSSLKNELNQGAKE